MIKFLTMVSFKSVAQNIKKNILSNKKKLSFNLIATAIFGSWAKGKATEDSDIDILVVVDNLKGASYNRHKATIELKKILNRLPVELLVFNMQEIKENFEAHNPLFLDIALDAKIIFDSDNFLKNLLNKTREYIKSSALIKTTDGWKMPVRKGAITYLSPISNKDLANTWLVEANRDLEAAQTLLDTKLFEKSVYHSQQATEKSIKAILSALGHYKKSHFVASELLKIVDEFNLSEPWNNKLKKMAEEAASIEPEISLARYPRIENGSIVSPSQEYNESKTNKYLNLAKQITATASDFLIWWFM